MSFQMPVSIMSILEGIQSNRFVLPAIQREFVWNAGQIERLFDSLMRGYPIGSFLFWKITAENVGNFQFYKFMDHFHQRDHRHNESVYLVGVGETTAILDGQQRLTALNIGLRGWYAEKLPYYRWDSEWAFPQRRLYLNLLSVPDGDADIGYEFRMLRERDANSTTTGKYWFPVSRVCEFTAVDDAFFYCVEHGLAREGDKIASSNLINLWRIVHERPVINYYEESAQDLDKVLHIFIRVNSGGTVLSYSDMLLSIASAQWNERDARKEINDLVDALNGIGEGYQFGKDFVLKTCLVLCDITAIEFKVSSFTRSNMALIENRWSEVSTALKLAVSLLASWGYSWQTLPSANALIPIAYHIYGVGNPPNYVQSAQYKAERSTLRNWLTAALLKRVFGGQSDTTLRTIRRVQQEHPDIFPADAIADALKQTRPIYFAKPDLDALLSYRYGQQYTFIVLSLLYPWLKYDQHFHVDHVFPKGLFNERELRRRGIPEERWSEWLDHVNDLANLQLLQGLPNQEKSDREFELWLAEEAPEPISLEAYRKNHLIPDVDLSFANFPVFVAEREKLLAKRLAELLNVQLEETVVLPEVETLTMYLSDEAAD
jgi:hypothetical protein